MLPNSNIADSCVLITGGTQGLGKAIGLAFAQAGASVVLTYKWGTVSPEQVQNEFEMAGIRPPPPLILQADVADSGDMEAVIRKIEQSGKELNVLISNVAVAKVIDDFRDYKLASLELSLKYSAWPVAELTKMAHEILGYYPKYIVALSSDGSEVCHPGYDFAGASKAVLETLCRYMAMRLRPHGVNVNVLRAGMVDTANLRQTLGADVVEQLKARSMLMDPTLVANACIAICSGYLDGMTGQVMTVDAGSSLVSPISYLTDVDSPRTE